MLRMQLYYLWSKLDSYKNVSNILSTFTDGKSLALGKLLTLTFGVYDKIKSNNGLGSSGIYSFKRIIFNYLATKEKLSLIKSTTWIKKIFTIILTNWYN